MTTERAGAEITRLAEARSIFGWRESSGEAKEAARLPAPNGALRGNW